MRAHRAAKAPGGRLAGDTAVEVALTSWSIARRSPARSVFAPARGLTKDVLGSGVAVSAFT